MGLHLDESPISTSPWEQNAGTTADTGGTGQQPIPAGSKPQQRKNILTGFLYT